MTLQRVGVSQSRRDCNPIHAGSDDGGSTEDPAVHFYDYPILKKKPHARLQPYEYESPGSTAREHQFPIEDVNPSTHYEFDNKY